MPPAARAGHATAGSCKGYQIALRQFKQCAERATMTFEQTREIGHGGEQDQTGSDENQW